MRTLRAIYNKAIQAGIAPDVSFLFKKVYTGVESKVKRSISPVAVERLIHADRQQLSKKHAEACDLFALQFYLRGMPFVDLLQLKRSNLYGNLLCYHRRKTGRRIVVKLEVEAQKILNRYLSTSVGSPYIFPLYRDAQLKNANHYQAYQSSLRKYNDALFRLTLQLKLGVKLTSYTPRHTWATTAYHSKQPLGLISNALGHSSITVTEHYLRPFS
ncbi:MAG: tyrosine-type recombinase/integrase, partial [Bacteroidaceae bacterium]